MLLDISEILRSVGSLFRFKLDETSLRLDGLDLASPVGGEITVSNSGARLLVRGNAWGDILLQCGRCLRTFVYPVDAEIEEDYDMRLVQRVASRQKIDDPTMQALFAGPAIDLNELLLQEFTLNLPINPICSPECEPPCAGCGKPIDLCRCERPPVERDPRWGPLLDRVTGESRSGE